MAKKVQSTVKLQVPATKATPAPPVGTALGAALQVASSAGETVLPMPDAYLGRGWTDDELEAWLTTARWPYERPASVARAVAAELAAGKVPSIRRIRDQLGCGQARAAAVQQALHAEVTR